MDQVRIPPQASGTGWPPLTASAQRSLVLPLSGRVVSRAALATRGIDRKQVAAQLAAHRWQRCGLAIVLHNGPLNRRQGWAAAAVNAGPRSMLAAFTALELQGLSGWERGEIHLLAPLSVATPVVAGLRIRLHRTRHWTLAPDPLTLRCQPTAAAAVLAASTFASARPACGILAAAVQQRLVTPPELGQVLRRSTRVRHRASLSAAVRDIAGGSGALSEIDFVRLCRTYRLPEPI